MSSTLLNIAIVLALILIEALFVASEIALVSLREGQVRALAESGRRGAAAVARLIGDPNRFLATAQIGVTLTALLSSAFGAITLSEQAKDALVDHGMSDGLAGPLGFVGVTLVISFVTLVVGELVPKRLGLQRAEGTARLVAPNRGDVRRGVADDQPGRQGGLRGAALALPGRRTGAGRRRGIRAHPGSAA